jgi:antitoxin YefM
MSTISVSQARKDLYNLVDQVGESHKPLVITSKRGDAVLISAADWQAIQETMHLLSVPGMRDSLIKGKKTPIEDCSSELDW